MSKLVIVIILSLLGLVSFGLIIAWAGPEIALNILTNPGFLCLICYILNAAVYLVITALSWQILLKSDKIKISFLDSTRANFMGFVVNFLTPSMYIGGEPLRALFVSKHSNENMRKVLAITIVGKFQEISSLVLFMIISAAVIVYTTGLLPKNMETAIVITIISITFIMIVLASVYALNLKPITNIIAILRRLGVKARTVVTLRAKIDELEQTIHTSFTKRMKPFILAQLLTLVSTSTLFIRPLIVFYFAKETNLMEIHHLCAIFLITNLINLLQIIPGSLGVFEGGLLLYSVYAGLGKESLIAFSVVNRLSDLTLLALGIWLLVHFGLTKLAKTKILGGT